MTSPDDIWRLPTRHLGREVWVFDRLDSTNNFALAMDATPERDGLVVLAHEQNAGRGQYERTWTAPPQSSVLMSLLLFPPPHLNRPVLLTAWAAVSVREFLRREIGLEARIKWPNDIIVNRKKICGILIEQRSSGTVSGPARTVVGIGFNVRQSVADFTNALLPDAGSLLSLTGRTYGSPEVARELIRSLDEEWQHLVAGDVTRLQTSWVDGLDLLGRDVEVELATETVVGRLIDLSFDRVELESTNGRYVWAPELIRHLSG